MSADVHLSWKALYTQESSPKQNISCAVNQKQTCKIELNQNIGGENFHVEK